jgi:hypothetical protein
MIQFKRGKKLPDIPVYARGINWDDALISRRENKKRVGDSHD